MIEKKLVTIKQSRSFTPIPVELRSEIDKKIGSKWDKDTSDVLIGLSQVEQKYILPRLVRNTKDNKDTDWETKVSHYFANMSIKVPYLEGKTLNIATTRMSVGKTIEDGKEVEIMFDMPVSPSDYTMYKQCIADPTVATTEIEVLNSNNFKFVLIDEGKEKDKKNVLADAYDKLDILRLKLLSKKKDSSEFKDPDKIDAVIRLFGKAPDFMSNEEKSVLLREERDASYTMMKDGIKLEQTPFFQIVNDPDLGIKAEIMIYVQTGILEQQGAYYRDPEKDVLIGSDIKQAVNYFKNPVNNSNVNKWRFAHKGKVTISEPVVEKV
jgi:hypothetical protein